MDTRLLNILVCPTSHEPLRVLDGEALQALNRAIDSGGVCNAGGENLNRHLSAALITRDGKIVYPVEDDIPVLLADQGITTATLESFPGN